MNQQQMLSDLQRRVQEEINWVREHLKDCSDALLQQRPAPDKWNALECFEHLNRYGDFYLSTFQQVLQQAGPRRREEFKPGWLGNTFANMMAPQDGVVKNKTNTFKSKNPIGEGITREAIDKHLQQQEQLLKILQEAQGKDLQQKMPTTLPLLRLRLGDGIRFYSNHVSRHLLQAQRAMSEGAAISNS